MDGLGFDEMIVIKDEDNPVGEGGNLVEQGGQNRFDVDRARGLQRGQCSFPNIAFNGLQGGDKVGQEAGQVVVPFVQREPGDGPLAASDSLAQQRRLAKAGRGRDERQFAVQTRVQPLDQARARHQLWPGGWDIEFGGQEWRGHFFFPSYGWCRFAREPGDSDSTILSRLIQTRNASNASGRSTPVQDRFALLPLAIQHYAPPAGNSMVSVVPRPGSLSTPMRLPVSTTRRRRRPQYFGSESFDIPNFPTLTPPGKYGIVLAHLFYNKRIQDHCPPLLPGPFRGLA